jgi:hypothetical protein
MVESGQGSKVDRKAKEGHVASYRCGLISYAATPVEFDSWVDIVAACRFDGEFTCSMYAGDLQIIRRHENRYTNAITCR